MFTPANKTLKTAPAITQKTAGNTFFRKASEETFFHTKEAPRFSGKPLHAKLTVSTPDDPHEKEADAVADKVMRMPQPILPSPLPEKKEEKLQRKEEEQVQAKQEMPVIKIQCKDNPGKKLLAKLDNVVYRTEEKLVDTKQAAPVETSDDRNVYTKNISLYPSDTIQQSGRGPPTSSMPFEQTLASSKGGGSALPGGTQTFMESRFNADFSGVRIHTDSTAQHLSSSVNAQAFAHGNDIYFNSGKFSPHTSEGGTLLAHELTHTIQQGASKSVDRVPGINNTSAKKNNKVQNREINLSPGTTWKNAQRKGVKIDNVTGAGEFTRKKETHDGVKGHNEKPTAQPDTLVIPLSTAKGISLSSGNNTKNRGPGETVHRSKEDDDIHAKKDAGNAEKIKIAEPVQAKIETACKIEPVKTAVVQPDTILSRSEEKELQKKEEQQEDKENSPSGSEFLINKKSIDKLVVPDACKCSKCTAIAVKHERSNASLSNSQANGNTIATASSVNIERERGPPALAGSEVIQCAAQNTVHITQQTAGNLVQRDDDPPGDAPKEESWLDKLKNTFDVVLKELLPDAIYNIYIKIRNGGILGFIKDSLVGLFKGLFGKLGFSDSEIQLIFRIFATLKAQLPAIIDGLSKGDCKPLFAALNILSEVVSAIAGRVWDNLMAELEPIRLWLIDIWNTFGAPVIDEITAFAGQQWEDLKALGKFVWDSFKPIRDKGEEAWDWVVKKLGFGTSDEPGLLSYISDKITEAWNSIKTELKPVIAPINDVIEGIKALASLGSIRQLQEDAKKWLDEVVKTATAMGSDEDAVANKQITLRQVLLPALNKAIDRLKSVLKTAGDWVVEKVGFVTNNVSSFISGLQGNTYLSPMYPLIKWMPAAVDGLKDWATDKVTDVFAQLQTGVDHLKAFIEPLLKLLEKLVGVVSNLLGNLPDLILGVPFMFMPRCIKDPIIKWLTEVVLKQIPIIGDFIALTEKWEEIKTAALTALKQVFVDGQLAKGLWTFFKELLNILGIDPKLVTKVIAKAAKNFSDIISKPGAFLKNIWNVIKGGFAKFWDNIGKHLLQGALDWLFGEVKSDKPVQLPKAPFSVGSILGFVLELFGITKDNVYERMRKNPRIGPEKVKKIQEIEGALTGALEWITVWIRDGPEGLLKKVKEKIGDLKNMVINAAVSWVTSKITAEITKKLATSADPLGIGATINVIIQIYDAIKAAVAYFNRILNVVNDAMDNMAEIIAGNTDSASQKFEDLLGKAVPVVIGFAVEAVLGKVGAKITEVVDKVHKKIDDAIDWLINGALNVIDSIIAGGKKAVGTVLGWLDIRKTFKDVKNKPHAVYFDKSGNLIIASEPTDANQFLTNQAIANASNPTMLQTVQNAQGSVQTINRMKQEMQSVQNLEGNQDAKATKYRELDAEITRLAALLTILGGTLRPSGKTSDPLDAIPITWHKPIKLYPQSITLNGETYSIYEQKRLRIPRRRDLPNVRGAAGDIGNEEITIGISPSSTNAPVIGKVWARTAVGEIRGGVAQTQFRELLEVSGFAWGTMEADHIRDLQWGGQDAYHNLWPLERAHNNAANNILTQDVVYEDAAGNFGPPVQLGNTPLNLYFRIKDTI